MKCLFLDSAGQQLVQLDQDIQTDLEQGDVSLQSFTTELLQQPNPVNMNVSTSTLPSLYQQVSVSSIELLETTHYNFTSPDHNSFTVNIKQSAPTVSDEPLEVEASDKTMNSFTNIPLSDRVTTKSTTLVPPDVENSSSLYQVPHKVSHTFELSLVTKPSGLTAMDSENIMTTIKLGNLGTVDILTTAITAKNLSVEGFTSLSIVTKTATSNSPMNIWTPMSTTEVTLSTPMSFDLVEDQAEHFTLREPITTLTGFSRTVPASSLKVTTQLEENILTNTITKTPTATIYLPEENFPVHTTVHSRELTSQLTLTIGISTRNISTDLFSALTVSVPTVSLSTVKVPTVSVPVVSVTSPPTPTTPKVLGNKFTKLWTAKELGVHDKTLSKLQSTRKPDNESNSSNVAYVTASENDGVTQLFKDFIDEVSIPANNQKVSSHAPTAKIPIDFITINILSNVLSLKAVDSLATSIVKNNGLRMSASSSTGTSAAGFEKTDKNWLNSTLDNTTTRRRPSTTTRSPPPIRWTTPKSLTKSDASAVCPFILATSVHPNISSSQIDKKPSLVEHSVSEETPVAFKKAKGGVHREATGKKGTVTSDQTVRSGITNLLNGSTVDAAIIHGKFLFILLYYLICFTIPCHNLGLEPRSGT